MRKITQLLTAKFPIMGHHNIYSFSLAFGQRVGISSNC